MHFRTHRLPLLRNTIMVWMSRATHCMIFLLFRAYRYLLSPLLHCIYAPQGGCRWNPGCSEYTETAIQMHGIQRGLFLGVCRLFRCHPWSRTGYDPVPRAIGEHIRHSCPRRQDIQGR